MSEYELDDKSLLLTKDRYNEKIQDMQKFCLSAGLEFRIVEKGTFFPEYGKLVKFEVFWNEWHELGSERTMSFDFPMYKNKDDIHSRVVADRKYNNKIDAEIRYEVVGHL